MTELSRALALARRQHGVIAYAQLRALGFTRAAILHQTRTRRLRGVHTGVYAVDGPLGRDGELMAAVLGVRDGAVGGRSAGWLHGYTRAWPPEPRVVVPRRTGARGPAGVRLRHSTTLTAADVTRRRGIPVTAPARTLVDCAPGLGAEELRRWLQEAERQRLDLRRLDRPGIPRALRSALDDHVPESGLTANELEARFYELCARAGLPLPARQTLFGDLEPRYRVDFVWTDARLVVETDGRETHEGWIAAGADRARDRWFVLHGWRVLRFTWADVRWRPDLVATEVAAALR